MKTDAPGAQNGETLQPDGETTPGASPLLPTPKKQPGAVPSCATGSTQTVAGGAGPVAVFSAEGYQPGEMYRMVREAFEAPKDGQAVPLEATKEAIGDILRQDRIDETARLVFVGSFLQDDEDDEVVMVREVAEWAYDAAEALESERARRYGA